jgi:hypothetical protein
MDEALARDQMVRRCVACGHDTFYIQKDFNRNTGLAIVAVGVLASIVFFARSEPLYAMLALVGAAGVDLAIYALMGEVTVCYPCHTVYRGFRKNPDHGPFELKDLEKYGGREPRF